MSKYNVNVPEKRITMRTLNKEGAPAFKPSDKTELVLRAATTLGKTDAFYEKSVASDRRFVQLIENVAMADPEFVLKLAYYTRNKFYLRTPTTILLAESSYVIRDMGGVPNGSKYVSKSIKRVDDMTELVAYMLAKNPIYGKSRSNLPMMIKRGIADAFPRFDEYQLAKYTTDNMVVTPTDVYFLTHPAPKSREQRKVYDRMIFNKLAVPDTWEEYIRNNGSTKENWTYILDRMGYMGIVRNLRNLIKNGVNADDVIAELTDRDRVLKSKMFPYQFYSAYRAIEKMDNTGAGAIMGGLSDAMDISVENFPRLSGTTAVFCDNSGSMHPTINTKSTIKYSDIGNVFGAMLAARGNTRVYAYGTDVIPVVINPRDSILTNSQKIMNSGARLQNNTYTYKCTDLLRKEGIDVDRIVFFTDEQGYGNNSCYDSLKTYRTQRGLNPFVFTFDIKHYGTTQFPEGEPRHATIGGWSDTILKFIHLYERDRTTLVEDVENVSI